MPPRYCFDTSGISNPYELLPSDIHETLWNFVHDTISNGAIAVTKEIFDEMCLIGGDLGDHIAAHEKEMLFEIDKGDWDSGAYIVCTKELSERHKDHISEYTGGSPKTICLNDMSIIALAKVLGLPVVSMEARLLGLDQTTKRRIPNICDAEGVTHMTFNEFLRAEGFRR